MDTKQQTQQAEKGQKAGGLPQQVQDSPYTRYKDLEDYKEKGYGTHGHQQPQPGRGAAASTDAPTSAGGRVRPESNKGSNDDPATDSDKQFVAPRSLLG